MHNIVQCPRDCVSKAALSIIHSKPLFISCKLEMRVCIVQHAATRFHSKTKHKCVVARLYVCTVQNCTCTCIVQLKHTYRILCSVVSYYTTLPRIHNLHTSIMKLILFLKVISLTELAVSFSTLITLFFRMLCALQFRSTIISAVYSDHFLVSVNFAWAISSSCSVCSQSLFTPYVDLVIN